MDMKVGKDDEGRGSGRDGWMDEWTERRRRKDRSRVRRDDDGWLGRGRWKGMRRRRGKTGLLKRGRHDEKQEGQALKLNVELGPIQSSPDIGLTSPIHVWIQIP